MTFIINISWLIFTIYKFSIIFIFLVKLLILNGGYMFQLNKTYMLSTILLILFLIQPVLYRNEGVT
jgi:hypothetical protein